MAGFHDNAGDYYNNECDSQGAGNCSAGETHRMELPGGAGINLCRTHWKRELGWRHDRNRELTGTARYPLPAWPGRGGSRRAKGGTVVHVAAYTRSAPRRRGR